MYNQSIKKKYYTLNLYIHPAETHRLLKFLFHRMGRLVPAHKKELKIYAQECNFIAKDTLCFQMLSIYLAICGHRFAYIPSSEIECKTSS